MLNQRSEKNVIIKNFVCDTNSDRIYIQGKISKANESLDSYLDLLKYTSAKFSAIYNRPLSMYSRISNTANLTRDNAAST